MPIVAVILEDNDAGHEIFNLKHIFHCIIKVEPRKKPTGPPKCRRCLQTGHTKNYCMLAPLCVKCFEPHLTSECTLPANSSPKCIRCKKNHPLNSPSCKAISSADLSHINNNIIKSKTFTTSPPQSPLPVHSPFPSRPSSSAQQYNIRNSTPLTYAQATAAPPPSYPPNNSNNSNAPFFSADNLTHILNTIINQIISSLLPIIKNTICSMFSSFSLNNDSK